MSTHDAAVVDADDAESLEAYFDACRSPTPPSPSPSFSDAEEDEEHNAQGAPGEGRSPLAQYAPLQGSVPRPLLQRQRQSSSGIIGGASATTEAVGASLLPALRGAAGSDVADRLQHAALPMDPVGALWADGSGAGAGRAAACAAAFAFHTPAAAAKPAKAARRSTTITTRGRRSGSMPTAAAPGDRARRLARQRAILFDVLCAVRQHRTASCEVSAPDTRDGAAASSSEPSPTWSLTEAVTTEARTEAWLPGILGALQQLLHIANHVAAVQALVQRVEAACAAESMPTADPMSVQEAAVALAAAGLDTLRRLARVLRLLCTDYVRWVLQVQEYLAVVCADAARDADEEAAAVDVVAETLLPAPHSLLDVVLAVEENSIPLQRCRLLAEESGCFDGLASQGDHQASAESAVPFPTPAVSFADLAARLLDTLIIQASAVQDTSTMDLYRFYVMLLIYAAWPYVLLSTAAIFGLVCGIDPPVWRRQLPRLFRSSFSHVRIGDAHRHYPTDVLSLLLNCVGYYDGTAGAGEGGGEERAGASAQWTPVVMTTGSRSGGGGGGVRRRKDTSEQQVALAALRSARTFVLRSLASFTRRKKQVALSRTPAKPPAVGPFKKAKAEQQQQTSGGAAASESPPMSMSWQRWQKKSVKDILHYILYEPGGLQETAEVEAEGGTGSSGNSRDASAVLAYAQGNQDVRRRVVQLPPSRSNRHVDAAAERPKEVVGGVDAPTLSAGLPAAPTRTTAGEQHFVYFPTTIPLGFATLAAEALPGQQQWQQQRDAVVAQQEAVAGAPTFAASPACVARRSLRSRSQPSRPSRGHLDDAYDDEENDVPHPSPLQRNAVSLWSLFITESATSPDVYFANASGQTAEDALHSCGFDSAADEDEEDEEGKKRLGGIGLQSASRSGGRRRPHSLWINVTIPCARWVTTALLIPIGVAVQRLQERRLHDLFAISLRALPAGDNGRGVGDFLWSNAEGGGGEGHGRAESAGTAFIPRVGPPTTTTTTAAACSFLHALKLVVDVALCRDQERLVTGFLESLFREPRWWARRWVDGGAAAFARSGTAAPAVSALFADAVRGKRLGELVRLVVLPANIVRRVPDAAQADTSSAAVAPAPPATTISADVLDMFASFRLVFTLPEAFALMLQPRDLSVYVQPVTNTTERSYQTFFWQRRRRIYVEEAAATRTTAAPNSAAPSPESGIAFADVWSYFFGYTCSLYYAQITLREQKKQLHQRDAHDAQMAQWMGRPGPTVARHLQYVSRGLGSAYYTLNFAVDALLSFTQAEAMRTVYDLEKLVRTAMRDAPGLHSCMELCHELDTLLLRLHGVSFPARPAVALNARERAMASPAAEAVRGAVQRILEVALDPSRLPVSYISATTRNSVEALVAAVTAAGDQESPLAAQLQSLRARLTFNRYYGTPEETLSYRFR